jgi:hypothetical protein
MGTHEMLIVSVKLSNSLDGQVKENSPVYGVGFRGYVVWSVAVLQPFLRALQLSSSVCMGQQEEAAVQYVAEN